MIDLRRRALSVLLAAAAILAGLLAPAPASAAPPIRHVFMIVLENQSASTTFGPGSPAPYLATTLRSQGAYLPNFHGVGHESNDNYIAMISGQAPNPQSQSDCQQFSDFAGTWARTARSSARAASSRRRCRRSPPS